MVHAWSSPASRATKEARDSTVFAEALSRITVDSTFAGLHGVRGNAERILPRAKRIRYRKDDVGRLERRPIVFHRTV